MTMSSIVAATTSIKRVEALLSTKPRIFRSNPVNMTVGDLFSTLSAKSTKIIQAASDDDFEPTPPPPKSINIRPGIVCQTLGIPMGKVQLKEKKTPSIADPVVADF
ncbi:hypothetical protein E3N88_15655 [Mikania micrantha]|uniref:Uncharacterized protein n=1 Tax=Mikania micrantha TaxID=192012 RepID=A0A5N6NZ85_9ASTR|nr:hypothetical protein E3N88_15655 [Mikania micrantha]